jgi:hypothetical protein
MGRLFKSSPLCSVVEGSIVVVVVVCATLPPPDCKPARLLTARDSSGEPLEFDFGLSLSLSRSLHRSSAPSSAESAACCPEDSLPSGAAVARVLARQSPSATKKCRSRPHWSASKPTCCVDRARRVCRSYDRVCVCVSLTDCPTLGLGTAQHANQIKLPLHNYLSLESTKQMKRE